MAKNSFGVDIEDSLDLSTITPTENILLPKGIYDVLMEKIDFSYSKSGNPMLKFSYKVLANEGAVLINAYVLLVGGISQKTNMPYDAPIKQYLAGIFECWQVPKEFRSLKHFNFAGDENYKLDPANTLFRSFNQYAKVASVNTQYVSKLMLRAEIIQEPDSTNPDKIYNKIAKFVKIENKIKQEPTVDSDNPFNAPF
jgi:hypothetical protein